MAEYAPAAIRACFDTVQAAIPGAVLSGIVGDPAHTYGYHRGRNYVSSSDYSVQRADDKQGHPDAACGLDISLSSADMKRVTQRLIDATMASDARIQVVREFFGTVNGTTVTGLDVRDKRWVTSDPSHLWHVHLSMYRRYADDHAAMQGVAAVLIGSGGGTAPPSGEWDEMATKDEVKQALRDVLNEATPQGMTGWAQSYRDIVYKAAHDLLHGAQNLTVPRIDAETGSPSMATPARHGNVLAYIDNRVSQCLDALRRIEQAMRGA
jgi:hypothetical protein